MINNGCGLCVELCKRGNKTLLVRCENKDDDVVVKNCLTPFVVATDVGKHSWGQGSYFMSLQDAVDYLNDET